MNKRIMLAAAAVAVVIVMLVVVNVARRPAAQGDGAVPAPSRKVVSALVNQARDLEQKNSHLEARDAYRKLIADFPGSADVMTWQKKSEELAMKVFFSPTITPKSVQYEIKPGDSLFKIAKAHKTTPELIMRMNNMQDAKIMPGRKIKVWNAAFSIFVDKSQNILMLKSGDEVLRTYVVSTGTNNSTPIGTFKIVNKLVNPTWFKAGAIVPSTSEENQLGTRWMGFDLAGYGIHGTIEPDQIGKQVTAGCVRMVNSDVEELYDIVPVGTEVIVVD